MPLIKVIFKVRFAFTATFGFSEIAVGWVEMWVFGRVLWQRFIDFDEVRLAENVVRQFWFNIGWFHAFPRGWSLLDFRGENIIFGEMHGCLLLCTFRVRSRFCLHFLEVVLGWRRVYWQGTQLSFEIERSITLFGAILLNNHYGVALHSYIITYFCYTGSSKHIEINLHFKSENSAAETGEEDQKTYYNYRNFYGFF